MCSTFQKSKQLFKKLKTKKMKTILKIAFLLTISLNIKAQQIINSAGGQGSTLSQQHDYSIGEMAVISTANSNNLIVTQGLLQPQEIKENAMANFSFDMVCYPNPTADIINMQMDIDTDATLVWSLYDAAGKLLQSNYKSVTQGSQINSINLKNYATGNYVLQVAVVHSNKMHKKNFNIQKQ
jgi:hypothetical protein